MASTSTSFIQKSFKYDVFLSFRGEDTRKNFVGHLYHALKQKGIITYKDDKNIEKGERINVQLIKSIEESRFYIIVFSKTYASSSWCLDELVKIMECQKTDEQTAYPVFYDVEPTELCKQSGAVKEAFSTNEKQEGAGKWIKAMIDASNLAGWELKDTANGDESETIQKIVDHVFNKLCSSCSSGNGNLVGMEMRVRKVLSYVNIYAEDVRMIGIKGIGGGGKTTLAQAVFEHLSIHFEGTSFVEKVREVSKGPSSGLMQLQKQVLSDVLGKEDITVSGVIKGTSMMAKMMRGRKVLVVLDDVDHKSQLEALAGDLSWFKSGSRIIITTRDEQVLVSHGVSLICSVHLLRDEEAVCLFRRYAFGKEILSERCNEMSGQVVGYAAGLPLTIRVLGSFLCGKNEREWKDALDRLKTIPEQETEKVLELSFDGLEKDYKEIFLNVACILKGYNKEYATRVLESCGFYALNGLRVLEQKSLITISGDGELGMHDRIEELGRNIVRRLHPDEPNRHSRLWIYEEIENILANELGTQATKYVTTRTRQLSANVLMKGLANMKDLRYLSVYSRSDGRKLDGVSPYLPNSLRFLKWDSYPFQSLPKTFQANNLVGLEISVSNMAQLWEDEEGKVLNKLRFLLFKGGKLRRVDLTLTPNLELLELLGCRNLVELHMPIQCLKLIHLELRSSALTTLRLGIAPNLLKLILDDCNDLVELEIPECPKLKYLELSLSKLMTFRLGIVQNLENLILKNCNDLVELEMPGECPKLKCLEVSQSKLTTFRLGIVQNLERLIVCHCNNLVEFEMPAECIKLTYLEISHSKLRTLDLGLTPNLEFLYLENCNGLVEIISTCEMKRLEYFYLSNCIRVEKLPEEIGRLECLQCLKIDGTGIRRLPRSIFQLKGLWVYGSPENLESCGLTSKTQIDFLGNIYCDI